MKIRELIKNIDYVYLQGNLDDEVKGLAHDNRLLKPQEGFICIAGTRFDSHDLISDVVAKGASLIVVEKDVELPEGVCAIRVKSSREVSPLLAEAFYDYPARKLKTVAITGSKGKTTSTHMMADIFRAAGYKTGTIGTNGAIMPVFDVSKTKVVNADLYHPIDCEETAGHYVYELANTTPDAMEMQMYLALMVECGCTHVVIEVSSQAMKMHRVDGMEFDYGIWTNLDFTDHIGGFEHKDEDDLICCKANMINQSRIGFLNRDDRSLHRFEAYLNEGKTLYYYGESENVDYRVSNITKTFDGYPGICFDVSGKTEGRVNINLPGGRGCGRQAGIQRKPLDRVAGGGSRPGGLQETRLLSAGGDGGGLQGVSGRPEGTAQYAGGPGCPVFERGFAPGAGPLCLRAAFPLFLWRLFPGEVSRADRHHRVP